MYWLVAKLLARLGARSVTELCASLDAGTVAGLGARLVAWLGASE